MKKCTFCGEIVASTTVICPWCGRRDTATRKPLIAWKILFSDITAGMSLIVATVFVGATIVVVFSNEETWLVLFFLLASLGAVLLAILLIKWRMRVFQRIFMEGIQLQALVTANDRTVRESAEPQTKDYLPGLLQYSYSYHGKQYQQTLPYVPGAEVPEQLRRGIFRMLRMEPPTNTTKWLTNLKRGDTIEIIINSENYEQSFLIRLYT